MLIKIRKITRDIVPCIFHFFYIQSHIVQLLFDCTVRGTVINHILFTVRQQVGRNRIEIVYNEKVICFFHCIFNLSLCLRQDGHGQSNARCHKTHRHTL